MAGNEFLASVRVEVSGSADRTDALADTVDYGALASLLLEVSGSRRFLTVEGLCGSYSRAVLDRYRKIQAIEVTIDKLSPAMAPVVQSCGVRLVRKR